MNNQLPKITIITPSYNQGSFITDTIDSVLNQNYPNLEYIILDGGSTDETAQIVRTYSKQVKWISESDRGQADAINKGIQLASGDILAFINSDDYYLPGVFNKIAKIFTENREVAWVTGNYYVVAENKKVIQSYIVKYKNLYRRKSNSHTLRLTNYIIQPSTFWRKKVNDEIGGLDSTLRYAFDYDFWIRMIDRYPHICINDPLSAFRLHNQSKSGKEYHPQFEEELMVLRRYECSRFEFFFHSFHNWLIVKAYEVIK